MILHAEQLVYRHAPGAPPVLDDVSLALDAGEILCLLGPNGTGKTTLLRCLIGSLQPESGSIRIDGERDVPARRRALTLAYVPQAGVGGSLSLLDVALMGRTPHLRPLAMPGARDRRLALEALERVGIAHLAQRPFDRVSGGERQLALIARALAQQPRLFLMDEPTASLDLGNQARVLSTLRALADDGLALLVTSHQPDHALLLDARVAALRDGRIHTAGHATEVLQAHTLSALYDTPIDVLARNGAPAACVPRLRSQAR
ncbi:ABC transporter ATP-binding protein [Thermomonas brevis]|uniref:ABC transporter ATP-binding protein n=1 Tax=Thermomonas brevis TaxID=215691 RepID=A0A7G9QSF4_9GAMM|nr:ABC transporter ATP-binding protein [Thermomonas brevis]QNN46279.1 ABC transporter ATP-binding protein [Thermomonas brevis]